LHAEVRNLGVKVEDGVLKIKNPHSDRKHGVHEQPSHFVVLVTQADDNEV
jgi:hypothetical protein